MAPPPPDLSAALADRYRIERELGAGGMATVYLAHDVKHNRGRLGGLADRRLDDASEGQTAQPPNRPTDYLFYVMPYVEGETLRDRLNREKQLPLDDALQIAREVQALRTQVYAR